ncbi:VOC family protein [Acanthopleuribacter pedis]|uniref:VOC family protein n=1 Tax=Acanthopleuribacter pedis TaxID=442870 RepID=A0A8J7PZ93_9BACT|nr:VOC family protein [Acanthopleuribacter pedis]MBO1317437.1 VOC family protein [Acanthopleuribacter pedis]
MKLSTIYPVITTQKLQESKAFYTELFGFQIFFENDWYIHMGNGTQQLAFMLPDHPTQQDIFKKAYNGEGLVLCFEVKDANAEFEAFQQKNVAIEVPLTDEAWGERHFALYDPNGIAINVTQMTQPSAEYQEGYAPQGEPAAG